MDFNNSEFHVHGNVLDLSNDIEKSLAELSEEERPSKVVVVVITDGQENASQEFRRDQIIKMVKEKTEKDVWQFVFLSADLDAFMDAEI